MISATSPDLRFIECPSGPAGLTRKGSGHRMAYWHWGANSADHVVLCAHGLTRQGRDFDVLAQALVDRTNGAWSVVCPDVVGRGQSDWLADPQAYQVPHYAADMLALIAALKPVSIDWVGTSMGGLIGLAVSAQLAATGHAAPVLRHLVLNDVGPAIEWRALERIGAYVGRAGSFASFEDAVDALWALSSSFGPHTPAQWSQLCRHMVKPVAVLGAASTWELHYDPALGLAFRSLNENQALQGEALLWQLYDSLTVPTLLLRGAQSDLLSTQTAQAMALRGPKARCIEFAGVGHAPTLVAPDQVQAVLDFLAQ